MKTKFPYLTGLVTLTLMLPAAADTIYSGLLDTPIPTTFTGTTVTVGDGTLNAFFGGVGVANNNFFQPARAGTGDLSAIVNFGAGTLIDSGIVLDAGLGYGGSFTHLGAGTTQFQAGDIGYLGFRLDGADYGWMRVVFTNNTGGGVIKDWAYETTGAAIATGNVLQSGSTVTLDSALGSFSIGTGSPIGGSNSLVKTGANTVTLTGTNSYSGTTTVNVGSLLVNGSITGGGTVTVAGGATLGGTGSINGPVIVNGILAPGASIESLATDALTLNGGSSFAYEMNSGAVLPSVAGDLQQVFGNLALSGTVSLGLTDLAVTPVAFAAGTKLSLINYAGGWNGGFFTYGGTTLPNGGVFTAGLNTWRINYDAISGGLNFATEYSGGHFVTLTAVPEPGSWFALGCLVGSGFLLRRRNR